MFAVRSPELDEYDFVGIDNFKAAQIATEYLLDLGHQKIGFVGNLHNSKTASHRVSGFIGKLMERGIPLNYDYITKATPTRAEKGTLKRWPY
ncbi:maltose regulon regulatory protein malI [Vibrio sp. JCM 19236]|nr:maltose regulon regulatory protein malI [Vibrio sp. JCM 19236]